ncbi:unnamed protein product [Brassicogethes aeneus]|uniref:MADF domain-containing protein n=1 Tax=Brassicogethes aeneus TaxID=1431903 RepID=A0A9P0FBP8_BRAAE|nr:unnamed protein product [Brassicogethes aeneus]
MDEKIISLVETFPHLYDKKNVLYKDKVAVENLWKTIGKLLQTEVSDCQARWAALRAHFSKERSKVLVSGSCSGKPEWSLYKCLQFLNTVVKRRRTFGNVANDEDTTSLEDPGTDDEISKEMDIPEATETEEIFMFNTDTGMLEPITPADTPTRSTSRGLSTSRASSAQSAVTSTPRGKNCAIQGTLNKAVHVFESFVASKSTSSSSTSSVQSFCDSLVADLNRLPPPQLRLCKIETMKVLDNYLSELEMQ